MKSSIWFKLGMVSAIPFGAAALALLVACASGGIVLNSVFEKAWPLLVTSGSVCALLFALHFFLCFVPRWGGKEYIKPA